ncbi:MAG: hypothetical protein GAK28_01949 [Luteibacter sp.]|nr:MAG: hypothetical protein GAK28_01949 [Luteibacter sp.]
MLAIRRQPARMQRMASTAMAILRDREQARSYNRTTTAVRQPGRRIAVLSADSTLPSLASGFMTGTGLPVRVSSRRV